MIREFKEFIMRGNVLDLAVAVIIGTAVGKIIGSFVSDILMPPLGMILGKVDFSNLFVNLSDRSYTSLADAQTAGAPTINYGLFLNNIINFLIVVLVIFLVVKLANSLQRPKAAPAATTKECPRCLSVIPLKASRCPHCTSELK